MAAAGRNPGQGGGLDRLAFRIAHHAGREPLRAE